MHNDNIRFDPCSLYLQAHNCTCPCTEENNSSFALGRGCAPLTSKILHRFVAKVICNINNVWWRRRTMASSSSGVFGLLSEKCNGLSKALNSRTCSPAHVSD